MPLLPNLKTGRLIESPEPIKIEIFFNEVTNQCVCNIWRSGVPFNQLTVIEMVLIFNKIVEGYLAAGLSDGPPSGAAAGKAGPHGTN